MTAIAHQLHFEPLVVTTNRFRRNPPDIASWELRVGLFRVYYEVDEQVRIVTIKRHDQTYWRKTEQRNLLSW
ncbi:MAG: addiction module toxin RelE [Chloroflexi bacterium]|nr:MAG: addiction module toxin RelE [Chloroflexota bacterium]